MQIQYTDFLCNLLKVYCTKKQDYIVHFKLKRAPLKVFNADYFENHYFNGERKIQSVTCVYLIIMKNNSYNKFLSVVNNCQEIKKHLFITVTL